MALWGNPICPPCLVANSMASLPRRRGYAYGLCASGFGADLVVEADLGARTKRGFCLVNHIPG